MHLSRISPLPRFAPEWHAEWNGHAITVHNRVTYERLWIDNILVHEHHARLHLEATATLRGEVVHDGEPHAVCAVIGSIRGGPTVGCHIFVDDQLVGGDVGEKLIVPSASAKTVEEQKQEARESIWLCAVTWLLWMLLIVGMGQAGGFVTVFLSFVLLWSIGVQAMRLGALEREKTRIE